jgi:hypothetical protein
MRRLASLVLLAAPSLALAFPMEALTPVERPNEPRAALAVGDSVMLGARDELLAIPGWSVTVDAVVCRQATRHVPGPKKCAGETFPDGIPSGLEGLRQARAAGTLGQVVVLSLGSNEGITGPQFEQLMVELAQVPRVVWMTTTVRRQQATNAVLRAGVRRHRNAVLVDWAAFSRGKPWFGKDGIHLNPAGRAAFAGLVARSLHAGPSPK